MSTLAVVEAILREVNRPVSVREIVEYAGERLPTKSKTPDTVVARDLSMDMKRKGDSSLFARTAPGRYTMREFVADSGTREANVTTSISDAAIGSPRAAIRSARAQTSDDSHSPAQEG